MPRFYDSGRSPVTRSATGCDTKRGDRDPVDMASVSEAVLPTIGVIAGDGVGPEVVARGAGGARRGRPAATASTTSSSAFDLGGERYLKTGEVLPDAVARPTCGAATPSSWARSGIPASPPGVLEKGILLRLRFEFHQYVNLRPVRLYPGRRDARSRARGPTTSTWSSSARTTKTSTSAPAGFTRKGTPEEVAIQTSINTRAGVERCLRFAFELARARAGSGPFRGLSRRRPRRGPGRAGHAGRQDQRADLRPRPLDAGLHRGRARLPRHQGRLSARRRLLHADGRQPRAVRRDRRPRTCSATSSPTWARCSRGGWAWPPRAT